MLEEKGSTIEVYNLIYKDKFNGNICELTNFK
jgi:hypothetical protein